MPKLSIIIPVYNTEPYLKECLDSVINQTFQDIEIIIVNDCSPDNSEEIILQYQHLDSRIKYIKHKENLGLGGARNTGIDHATGTWITFIDSDDYVDLNTYQDMISLLENSNANLALFSAINFDHLTKTESYDPYFDIDILTSSIIDNSNFLCNASICVKIFKLSDITNNSLRFPELLKHEDEEFWFKYIASVEPLTIGSNKKHYHYRQRSDSIMGQLSHSRKDLPHIFLNIYHFLLKHNLINKYRKCFLLQVSYLYNNYNICDPQYQQHFYNTSQELLELLHLSKEEYYQYPYLLSFHVDNTNTQKKFCFLVEQHHSLVEQHHSLVEQHHSLVKSIEILYNNKWYQFGQLSRNQKIKKILSILLKKIHIYSPIKSLCNILRNKHVNIKNL